MSLKTWKAKYYPVPAKKVSSADALDHSIRKWQGLLPGARKRHGLRVDGKILYETDTTDELFISEGTCALCAHFISSTCSACPLAISRDGTRCDRHDEDYDKSPYGAFVSLGDARPMLKALRKAKKDAIVRRGRA